MKSNEYVLIKMAFMRHKEPNTLIYLAYYCHTEPKQKAHPKIDSQHIWELRIFEEKPFVDKMKEYVETDKRIEHFVMPGMNDFDFYLYSKKSFRITKGYFGKTFLNRVNKCYPDWKTGMWELKTANRPSWYPLDEYYLEDGTKLPDLNWVLIDKLKAGTVARRCSKKYKNYVKIDFPGKLNVPFTFN